MSKMKFKIEIFIITVVLQGCFGEFPEVVIKEGKLIGSYGTNRNGRQFSQFLGIPYGFVAKRFDISVPVKPWNGTKLVQNSGPGCSRFGLMVPGFAGVEDCLTLDVYTPNITKLGETGEQLPVMVWITGGGFVDGSAGMYGGKYFMEKDVVLVTINYRLGAFGFLNAGVKSARGNQGLKDMVVALKWVQKNIGSFSGNKDQVTIFGESAGGASVSLLTLSPMAKGLFHRAIMQSGTATCPYVLRSGNGIKHAKNLASAVDCPSSNNEYLVECLQKINPKELAKLTNFFNDFGFDVNAIQMGPTFETYGIPNDDNVFLTDDPFKLADNGTFNKVPIIIGMVSHESRTSAQIILSKPQYLKKLNTQFGRIVPSSLLYQETAEDPSIVTEKVREFYFNSSELTEDSLEDLTAMFSDRYIVHCSRIMAAAYAKHTQVYAFNYTKQEIENTGLGPVIVTLESKEHRTSKKRPPIHADELQHLFEFSPPLSLFFPNIEKSAQGFNFSSNFISMWYSFAKDGHPGKSWGDQNVEWTPLEDGKRQRYLQLDENPRMADADDKFEKSWKFWEGLSLKENGKSWE